jgi:ribosomal protein S27E
MKIIQRGSDPRAEPIQATCRNCQTVFEFHPLEAKYSSDQRDGDFYSIGCPVCGQTVYKDARRGGHPYD